VNLIFSLLNSPVKGKNRLYKKAGLKPITLLK